MIDTVVFDLFGVIAHHQSEAGKDRPVRVAEVPAAAFWAAYWTHRRTPDRVLFIDDRQDNIDAAAAVGLHTHLFTGARAATEAIRRA